MDGPKVRAFAGRKAMMVNRTRFPNMANERIAEAKILVGRGQVVTETVYSGTDTRRVGVRRGIAKLRQADEGFQTELGQVGGPRHRAAGRTWRVANGSNLSGLQT